MTWNWSSASTATTHQHHLVIRISDGFYDTNAPRRVGIRPAAFSTGVEMVAPWSAVWDVNGYYRDLGVLPNATRKQIRLAYQERQGWRSDRLTYIVSQLLNPDVRAKYDSAQMGHIFIDKYVLDWLRRESIQKAQEAYARGEISQEAWEQQHVEVAEESEIDPAIGSEVSHVVGTVSDEWPWGYYLWGTTCTDRERLRQWQEHLVAAFSETREVREIAVGFSGDMASPWGVQMVGYLLVVFLNEHEQPTEALARQAASRVIAS